MSDDLAGAIARRETDPGDEPSNLPVTAAFGRPDAARILQIIGLDPRDPRAHAVVAVAERYGLDPVLGHIAIIPKSAMPYITRDGFLFIAHRSGQLDGITVEDGPRRDGAEREWSCKVAVWRKDMTRPFTYPGRAALTLDNGPEMAMARAERRALKRAFAITVPDVFAEDEDDTRTWLPGPADDGASPAAVREEGPAPAAGPERAAPPAVKALHAQFRAAGITDRRERLAMLTDWAGREITSAGDLTAPEASDALARLAERRRDAQAAAEDEEPPGEPPPPEAQDRPATNEQRTRVITALSAVGITRKGDVLSMLTGWTGRDITATGDLTESEATAAIANAAALGTVTPGEEPGDE